METRELTNELLRSKMPDAMVTKNFIADFNTAKSPGMFSVTETAKNRPSGAYEYGTLVVTWGGYFGYQEYMEYKTSPRVYRRMFDKDSFHPWVQIAGPATS